MHYDSIKLSSEYKGFKARLSKISRSELCERERQVFYEKFTFRSQLYGAFLKGIAHIFERINHTIGDIPSDDEK